MYVCMYVCMYVNICIHYVDIRRYIYRQTARKLRFQNVCVDIYIYVCMYVRMYIYICMYMYVCIYICIYIHICRYIYRQTARAPRFQNVCAHVTVELNDN